METFFPMEFTEKLMNQTWENKKRPNSRPDIGLFGPNLGAENWQFLPKLVVRHGSSLSFYTS